MNRKTIEKMKAEVLNHIRNTPFEQLHEELIESGLKEHQNTKNVVRSENKLDSPFNFVCWKGYVTDINDNGEYDVELIDMVDLGTREQATISDDEIFGNPDVQKGSVFMWVIITDNNNEASSVIFQRDGEPESPEVYHEIAQRAESLAKEINNK